MFDKVNDDSMFFHMKIKKMLVVSSRDFVGISSRFFDDQGLENILLYSLEHPDKPPMTDGTIRGEIIVGGWHFQADGPNRTFAKNFVLNDYKGNIPKFVLNMGAPTQATVFKNIKIAIAKLIENGEL